MLPRSTAASVLGFALALVAGCASHHGARGPVDAGADAVFSTSCVVEPDLLVHGAGLALGHAPDASTATCETHDNGQIVERSLRACPAEITRAVERWEPDVIVGLGGGILAPHHAGCATQQRARAVQEFFERLARRPMVILTGHGPNEPPHTLDVFEARCAAARLAQQTLREPWLAQQAAPADADAPARLTESEYMCAEMLRAYAPDEWPAVLARIVFEPRAQSTVDNAEFASALIAERHLRRALVVSTPVVYARRGEDNHPYRALCDFRAVRAHYGEFHIAAVGCPFAEDGAAWGDFE